jgi:hypothetical protein
MPKIAIYGEGGTADTNEIAAALDNLLKILK